MGKTKTIQNGLSHVEDSVISLPIVENGVTWFGDLWNCTTSKFMGASILDLTLLSENSEEFVQVVPVGDSSFNLRHIRSAEDRLTSLEVSAEVSLELIGGSVKVAGGVDFSKSNQKGFKEEEIFCQLNVSTCVARLRPTIRGNNNGNPGIIHEGIKNRIINGDLRGSTHYLKEIHFGGNALGSIRISENLKDDSLYLGGFLEGKFLVGPISIGIKASLEFLDDEKQTHYSKTVIFNSSPDLGSPSGEEPIKSMFECFDKMDDELTKEYNPQFFHHAIVNGMPVLFKLGPLSELFDTGRDPQYIVIEDDTMKEFKGMMVTLHDMTRDEYIKSRIRTTDSRIQTIFQTEGKNNENPFTSQITQFESEIQGMAEDLIEKANEIFQDYKQGKKELDAIQEIIAEFNQKINPLSISEQVRKFVIAGKNILIAVHAPDAFLTENPNLFIKSEHEFSQWFDKETTEIKIFLESNWEGQGQFLKLYSMTPLLKSCGVEVRIAYPNVRMGSNLHMKIEHAVTTFKAQEIPFFLQILAIHLPGKMTNAKLFLYNLATSKGLHISPSLIHTTPSVVEVLKTDGVKICESYPEFMESLVNSSTQWQFVLPIQGLYSIPEIIWTYTNLKNRLAERIPNLSCDWIVPQFNMSKSNLNAPILIVYKEGQLTFVCLDHLDIYILMFHLTNPVPVAAATAASALDDLTSFCLYPSRANFGREILEIGSWDHRTTIRDPIKDLPSFEQVAPLPGFNDSLAVIQAAATSGDVIHLATIIGEFCVRDFEDLVPLFKRFGWTEQNGFGHLTDSEEWKKLATELFWFLEEKNELRAKTENVVDLVVATTRGRRRRTTTNGSQNLFDILKVFGGTFEDEDFNVRQLKGIAKELGAETRNVRMNDICFDYVRQIGIRDEDYPGQVKKIQNALETEIPEFYQALGLLAQCQYDSRLFKLQTDLKHSLIRFEDFEHMRKVVESMLTSYGFNQANCKDVFSNPKIQFWFHQGINNDGVIATIEKWFCKDGSIPSYLPIAIAEKIRVNQSNVGIGSNYHWSRKWENMNDVEQVFQIIWTRKILPKSFSYVLLTNLIENSTLLLEMQKSFRELYWDEKESCFSGSWGMDTIKNALESLKIYRTPNQLIKPISNKSTTSNKSANRRNPFKNSTGGGLPIFLNKSWFKFGAKNGILFPLENYQLENIRKSPQIELSKLNTTLDLVLPYIMQQLNSSRTSNLHPSQTVQYLDYHGLWKGRHRPGQIPLEKSDPQGKVSGGLAPFLLTRSDLLTALLTASNPIHTHFILRELAQVPLALPLIIPDISLEKEESLVLPTKSFFEPLGEIITPEFIHTLAQPHVFNDPYKFIVAIRVGTPSVVGKSTILNQTVMIDTNFWSCRTEPGAQYGPPVSREGLVELTWLSNKTYRSHILNDKEMILLANVHGDAIKIQDVIAKLLPMATCFLVFWSIPSWNELKIKQRELKGLIGSTTKCLDLVVDPNQSIINQIGLHNSIQTNELANECGKMETILAEAMTYTRNYQPRREDSTNDHHLRQVLREVNTYKSTKSRDKRAMLNKVYEALNTATNRNDTMSHDTPIPGISTPESLVLVNVVEKTGIYNVRNALSETTEGSNEILEEVIPLFTKLLQLDLTQRNQGLAHLAYELEYLRVKAAQNELKRLLKLNEEISSQTKTGQELIDLENEAKLAVAALNGLSLCIDHLFSHVNKNTEEYFEPFFQFLECGHSIQIFNEDSKNENIMWGPAMQFCFDKLANQRVFVLSTLGLQSAFKSTLLNELFGYSFDVGCGGCTQGLVMRIIHLEPGLQSTVNVDIVILLDSEGLRAPHNWSSLNPKEKQLMAFILGISHLTLLTTTKEERSLADLRDLLQMSLLSMYKVLDLKILPDILIVGLEKRETFRIEFQQVLNAVMNQSQQNEFEIGARNSKLFRFDKLLQSLATPSTSVLNDTKDLSAFYSTLIGKMRTSDNILSTSEWYEYIAAFWNIIKQNSPADFKNLEDFQFNLENAELFNEIKRKINESLRKHGQEIERDYLAWIGQCQGKEETEGEKIIDRLENFPFNCEEGEGNSPCQECKPVIQLNDQIIEESKTQEIRDYLQTQRNFIRERLYQMSAAKQISEGLDEKELSKVLSTILEEFEDKEIQWIKFKQFVSTKLKVIPANRQMNNEIHEEYKIYPQLMSWLPIDSNSNPLPPLNSISTFDDSDRNWTISPLNPWKSNAMSWEQSILLETKLEDLMNEIRVKWGVDIYHTGMVADICQSVQALIQELEIKWSLEILPDFKISVHFQALRLFYNQIKELEYEWKKTHDPMIQLEKKKDLFPNLFATMNRTHY